MFFSTQFTLPSLYCVKRYISIYPILFDHCPFQTHVICLYGYSCSCLSVSNMLLISFVSCYFLSLSSPFLFICLPFSLSVSLPPPLLTLSLSPPLLSNSPLLLFLCAFNVNQQQIEYRSKIHFSSSPSLFFGKAHFNVPYIFFLSITEIYKKKKQPKKFLTL